MKKIKGNIVDVFNKKIYKGEIKIENDKIVEINEVSGNVPSQYMLPGFIDAHVHIESSMLIPERFSELSMQHGTIGAVCDPHEIANVLGVEGVDFMIKNSKRTPQKLYFGAPSCVPATEFETSGASLGPKETEQLLKKDEIYLLGEMMNFPGVIYENEDVMQKIALAKKYNKPIDGHAPMLHGENLKKYVLAGITSDHECTTIDEAIEKLSLGMKILIRNGSAAKDFDALYKLTDLYPDKIMFCTDDSHPDDLALGHINLMVIESIKRGLNLFNVLRAASINPVLHYNLPIGLLRAGDPADFIIVEDLKNFTLKDIFINGDSVKNWKTSKILQNKPNNFNIKKISIDALKLKAKSNKARIIIAKDKSLLTKTEISDIKHTNGYLTADLENDILKIVVVNRYKQTKPEIGLIKGFGLKNSAIATSVAHDSHNIIAVGSDDEKIVQAINLIIESKGGMAFVGQNETELLKLPVAGLMSDEAPIYIANKYEQITKKVILNGSTLKSPFMTLSFMALLVIPELKIGDKGLFDVNKFSFTNLFV